MATKSIGALGTPRAPIDLTFEYFGLVVRIHPDATDLDLHEFMFGAASIEEADQVKGMVALGKFLHNLVHPEDWDTFWAAAKGNRQNLKDLMETAHTILEAINGFPTGQPSDSSNGRQNTPAKSTAGSSSRDTEKRALHLLRGRPDLQSAVVRAVEARQLEAG